MPKKQLSQPSKPLIFQQKEIRRTWHQKQWWFSVIDIIETLTESTNPRDYWFKMKIRVKSEDKLQLSTICRQLKLESTDGKKYKTDCANTENIFRIIQSIPSKKAEPFKRWLAKVGKERLDEIQNPELAMKRMKVIYKKKGYPKTWIEKRIRGIAVRNELTDEWKNRGAQEGRDYAILTNEIFQGTFDSSIKQYKEFKGLDKENLRDHMVDIELILTMLGEATTTKLHQDRKSQGLPKLKQDAKEGGIVAGNTRKEIERRSKQPVKTKKNYLNQSSQNLL